MAYVNDAQTLADVVGGASAAAQMGIQNDAANQEQQIKNTTLQGQQAADIAKPGLQNLFTQAQTANENAVGQSNQQTADIGKATMDSTIGAKNAGNQATMTADQAKSLGTFGTTAGQIAGMMDSVPPPARAAAMQQVAQHYGIDLTSLPPELQSGDPDILRQVSQKAIQASSSYQTDMAKQGLENSGRADVANITSDARVQAAQLSAQARETAAKIQQQTKQQQQSFEQAAVAAQKAGNIPLANQYAAAAEKMRQLGAQTTATLMGYNPNSPAFAGMGDGGSTPTFGGGGGTPPTTPASAAPDSNAIAAEMKRRGLLK